MGYRQIMGHGFVVDLAVLAQHLDTILQFFANTNDSMIPSDLGLPVMNIRKCVTIKNEYFEIKKSHSCLLDYMAVEV